MAHYNRNSFSALLKRPWTLWSLLLSVFCLVLLLSMMPLVNVGYADSDALLTVGYQGGLAHPPGYPVYTRLLYLFTHLPLFDSVAARGHFLSVMLATLAILFTVIAMGVYFDRYLAKPVKTLAPYLASLFLVGGLLLNRQFVTYSIITEKYAFSALALSIMLLLLMLLIKTTAKRLPALLFLLSIAFGLSLSHHQSLIAFIPPIAYALYKKRALITQKRALISLAIAVVAFLLPYGAALLIAQNPPEVSWHTEPTVNGLLQLITRQEFSGTMHQRGETIGAYWSGLNINSWMNSGLNYLMVLFTQNGLVISVLLAISLFRYLKYPQPKSTIIGIAALSQGLLLAAYLSWPADWGSQANTMRQYVPGFIPVVFFASLSLPFIYARLIKSLSLLFKPQKTLLVVLLVILVPLILDTLIRLPSYSLKNFDLVSRRYQKIIENVKEDALITCYSDTGCFALMYEHYVNGLRPDIDIVPVSYPFVQQVLDKPGIRHFSYTQNPYMLFDIVSWNVDNRPVYAVEIDDFYYNFFDLEFPYIYYVPEGEMGLLTRTIPPDIPPVPVSLLPEWLEYRVHRHDPMQLFLKSQVARDHIINGSMYLKMDMREKAQIELNQATNLFFQYGQVEQDQITALKTQVERQMPLENYRPGSSVVSAQELVDLVPVFLENGQNSRALKAAFGAVFIDPANVEARLALASLYERMKDYYFAKLEYSNVLILDQDNETAITRLNAIEKLTL